MILNCRRPVRIVAVAMLKVNALLTNETKEKMGFAVPINNYRFIFFKKNHHSTVRVNYCCFYMAAGWGFLGRSDGKATPTATNRRGRCQIRVSRAPHRNPRGQ
jgi:hypothetical protein